MNQDTNTTAELLKRAGVRPYKPGEPWVWAFDLEFGRTARVMVDRWDVDGMPPTRTTT